MPRCPNCAGKVIRSNFTFSIVTNDPNEPKKTPYSCPHCNTLIATGEKELEKFLRKRNKEKVQMLIGYKVLALNKDGMFSAVDHIGRMKYRLGVWNKPKPHDPPNGPLAVFINYRDAVKFKDAEKRPYEIMVVRKCKYIPHKPLTTSYLSLWTFISTRYDRMGNPIQKAKETEDGLPKHQLPTGTDFAEKLFLLENT